MICTYLVQKPVFTILDVNVEIELGAIVLFYDVGALFYVILCIVSDKVVGTELVLENDFLRGIFTLCGL
jgi:hypothetical protein